MLQKETNIAVDDRVGFALVYLSDHKLMEYLNKLSTELCEQGNLDGLLLTGKFKNNYEYIFETPRNQNGKYLILYRK